MAESLRSKFKEHLCCAICFEQLRDPKVLPCLHSYCHGCIAKLDMTGNILTCPECRSTLKVPAPPDVSFLPSNFFAKNLQATLLLATECDAGDIVCENCDSGDQPETRCQKCARYLCKFCTKSHKRSRDTKTHALSTLDELRESETPVIAETVRCPKHEDEVMKLYCKTCHETICRDCTIVDHRQHDYVFAKDVSEEKKGELLRLVEEVRQKRTEISENLAYLKKMEENVNESNESTVQKINEYFEDLETGLDVKKNEFLEEATSIKSIKLKQLHLQQEEFELNLGSCDSSIEFTEQAFKNGNDMQILNLTKYMSQCLENLKDKSTKIQPPYEDRLQFQEKLTEESNLCKRMAKFQFVKGDNDADKDEFTATFRTSSQYLVVDQESEITVKRKDTSKTAEKNRGMINLSPCFEGVAVRDVSVADNDDGSRTVSFCALHVGELRFTAFMSGSPVPGCVLTKRVKCVLTKRVKKPLSLMSV